MYLLVQVAGVRRIGKAKERRKIDIGPQSIKVRSCDSREIEARAN
jgi:hypothetical protein